MASKEELSRWLACSEKDYSQGLGILLSLGIQVSNPDFFRVVKPSRLHRSLLFRYLDGYARVHSIRPTAGGEHRLASRLAVPESGPAQKASGTPALAGDPEAASDQGRERIRVDGNPYVRFEELSPRCQVLYQENGRLYREMKAYHAELRLLRHDPGKKERRQELARELVSHSRTVRRNWNEIDHWWQQHKAQGKAGDPAFGDANPAEDPGAVRQKRIRANLNYIRRNGANPKHRVELQRRMDELDKMGVSYEKLLGKVSTVKG